MIFRQQKITIFHIRKPHDETLNENLKWLGSSLGLFNLRDKEKSCYRVFVELLKSARTSKPISSDELAYKLSLTRGTVVHHLNKLMESGIVLSVSGGYILRVSNLKQLIDELENDSKRMFENLRNVAENIDDNLGL